MSKRGCWKDDKIGGEGISLPITKMKIGKFVPIWRGKLFNLTLIPYFPPSIIFGGGYPIAANVPFM